MSAEERNMALTTVLAKPWWESKTIWLNVLGVIVLLVGILLDAGDELLLPTQALAWLGVILAAANGLLRFATRQPLASGSGQTVEVPAPPGGQPAEAPPADWDRST